MATAPTRTLDGPTCAVHAWPLVDGVCRICEGRRAHGIEPAPPLPPVDTWPRALRVAILAALEQRATQHPMSDAAARRQGSWSLWLRSAAEDFGLVARNGVPLPDHAVYARFVAHVERLTLENA